MPSISELRQTALNIVNPDNSVSPVTGLSPLPIYLPAGSSSVRVSTGTRSCVGRQTLSLTSGVVATLTVPTGAVACLMQADGATVRFTLDGITTPTATVGSRIDDGVFFPVDSSLTDVKVTAQSTGCNLQVSYFNSP